MLPVIAHMMQYEFESGERMAFCEGKRISWRVTQGGRYYETEIERPLVGRFMKA